MRLFYIGFLISLFSALFMDKKNPPKHPVLIALGHFNGLSSIDSCKAVGNALNNLHIPHELFPLPTQGPDLVEIVNFYLKGEILTIETSDPLGRKANSKILCLPDSNCPNSIIINAADTCSFHPSRPNDLDVMRTSSFGLGELLHIIIKKWAKTLTNIYMGLNDLATFDMGMGLLYALGFRFHDAGGHSLWGNAHGLRLVRSFQGSNLPSIEKIKFTILCNEMNPLFDSSGAAEISAVKSGASTSQENLIKQGVVHFLKFINQSTGQQVREIPMTSTGNGIAATMAIFLNASLVHRFRFLLNWLRFRSFLARNSLLVAGEDTIDFRTLTGQPSELILEAANELHKNILLFSKTPAKGHPDMASNPYLLGCFQCGEQPTIKAALDNLTHEVFSQKDIFQISETTI